MKSDITIATLIKDEKRLGANTAARVGGLLEDIITDLTTLSTSGEIDITQSFAILDQYGTRERCGVYRLQGALGDAGLLLVLGDNMGHVVQQWLVGNYLVQDGEVHGAHTDSALTIVGRIHALASITAGAEQGQWTPWRTVVESQAVVAPAYAKVVTWSGQTVSGVDIQSIGVQAQGGTVVYDTTRRTFLLQLTVGGAARYYAEWKGREELQDNVWTEGDGFVARFKGGTLYSGADGSLWAATAADTLTRVAAGGGDCGCVVDDELDPASDNAVSNKAVTEAIEELNTWNEA